MNTIPHRAARILIIAASTRTDSIHRALARRIAARLTTTARVDATAPVDIVDLRDYEMPLYDGDHERRLGVPSAAAALTERLASAGVLVIVSPEYNGTFTPLLKNTVDWVTRVDTAALAHLRVLIASASPGSGGGAKGAAMVRTWLANMGVATAEHTLCVGGASLDSHGEFVEIDDHQLTRFVRQAELHRFAA